MSISIREIGINKKKTKILIKGSSSICSIEMSLLIEQYKLISTLYIHNVNLVHHISLIILSELLADSICNSVRKGY